MIFGADTPDQPGDARRIFVAAPMSGFESDEEYQSNNAVVLRVTEALDARFGADNVYCAGRSVLSADAFDPHSDGVLRDLAALDQADAFILIYPRKVATSALIEAGAALARRIPVTAFVRQLDDAPYMLRRLSETPKSPSFVAIRTYGDAEDILRQLGEAPRSAMR